MKAAPFEFARAASLAETCALLAAHGGEAKLIAGGQSLVPMMAMRLARPAFLIDINDAALCRSSCGCHAPRPRRSVRLVNDR